MWTNMKFLLTCWFQGFAGRTTDSLPRRDLSIYYSDQFFQETLGIYKDSDVMRNNGYHPMSRTTRVTSQEHSNKRLEGGGRNGSGDWPHNQRFAVTKPHKELVEKILCLSCPFTQDWEIPYLMRLCNDIRLSASKVKSVTSLSLYRF